MASLQMVKARWTSFFTSLHLAFQIARRALFFAPYKFPAASYAFLHSLKYLVRSFFLEKMMVRFSFWIFISMGLKVFWCHYFRAILNLNWPSRSMTLTNCFKVLWHFSSNLQ